MIEKPGVHGHMKWPDSARPLQNSYNSDQYNLCFLQLSGKLFFKLGETFVDTKLDPKTAIPLSFAMIGPIVNLPIEVKQIHKQTTFY